MGPQWQHSVPRALRTETNFQTNVSGKHRVDIYSTTLQVRISLNGIYMYDLTDTYGKYNLSALYRQMDNINIYS
ncbi:hypothetical protein PoB_001935600 [Plakobranchus ocellatus]|uniref:Galectin n=1 Tax=Plakobranchus ocellatus TaxID=259542 RepID=A0AAV3ZA88_9GAST|nr:hypothetical protein PoB_001935600 [Plakobranchus ocellatus]